jgi:hypothetical protein
LTGDEGDRSLHSGGRIGGLWPGGRFALILSLTSLLLTLLVARNIYLGFRGPDLAAARLAERRSYYEQVIRKAPVSLREAEYYEVIR